MSFDFHTRRLEARDPLANNLGNPCPTETYDPYEVARVVGTWSLLSVAAYNVIELCLAISRTFERKHGLYFVSITVATSALAMYILGCAMLWGDLYTQVVGDYTYTVSWPFIGTAHIVVLYSRLYLVLHSQRALRAVLIFIIVTSLLSVPMQLVVPLLVVGGADPVDLLRDIVNWTQTVVLFGSMARELIIGGVYVVQAYRYFHPIAQVKGKKGRNVLVNVIIVQVAVLVLDAGLIAMWFTWAGVMNGFTAFMYSVKLKMEFAVLNMLVTLVNSPIVLGGLDGSDEESGSGRMTLNLQQLSSRARE
ncbi:hypothetical protein BDW74DRAFT_155155 [Aspergillus multicolor]|uniref:uncharacterized protein n=1 Tax=Aspergillus multicolor TaxID=41759 RepID=UPI003CCD0343